MQTGYSYKIEKTPAKETIYGLKFILKMEKNFNLDPNICLKTC